ncbi:MAG: type II toxin-antitoxin system RelE/ParE family toxin [Planctomycetaceae bacterium]|nr:type II toxin-antitoxin system RelE/ParE family toxin [Planctomycetaceae bacterium]
MTQINFQQQAARELREVTDWYAERDVSVTERFHSEVESCLTRIVEDPDSHPLEYRHYRWIRVRRFPYRLIFEKLDQDRILILAVAHTSRHPRYWTERTE